MMTTLTARPEAITFDPQQSALIVVDMQNAYATPGGYLDLAGFDVSTTRPVIANIQTRRDRSASGRDADHLVSKWLG
ncbi:isochorismatase family protein ycdL [Escherichia coli]|nr:isochorismatase family protein ycdL [Escherichia coli]